VKADRTRDHRPTDALTEGGLRARLTLVTLDHQNAARQIQPPRIINFYESRPEKARVTAAARLETCSLS
jgi:hypothetical protein